MKSTLVIFLYPLSLIQFSPLLLESESAFSNLLIFIFGEKAKKERMKDRENERQTKRKKQRTECLSLKKGAKERTPNKVTKR